MRGAVRIVQEALGLMVQMVQMVHTKSRCRVGVFAHDTPSDTREQFGDRAALGVLVGKLKNRGALPRDGVFPDLADLDRCTVRQ
jgi:hypothetical protein